MSQIVEVNAELSAVGAVRALDPTEVGVYSAEKIAVGLERISFTGLLLLIPLAAIPYGAVQPWWTAVINCAIFFLVSLRIGEATLRGDWRISGAALIVPLLALCVFAGFQMVPLGSLQLNTIDSGAAWRTISTDPHETQRFVFRLLALVLAGESLLRYTSTRRRLATLVGVVVGIGVLSAGFGVVRQIVQTDPAGFILPNLGVGEGFGQFINRNHFALLMEMSLGLLVGLVIGVRGQSRTRNRFLPYLSMALLLWIALVFTNSRGGVISMLGLILCAAIVHLTTQKWRSMKRQGPQTRSWIVKYGSVAAMSGGLAISLIVLTAVGVAWVGGDPAVSRLESVSGELSTVDAGRINRKEIWSATWRLIKAHPLTGIGFGGYESAITRFDSGSTGERSLRQAHNDYLEILASGGIIGAAFVLWFIVALVRKMFTQLRDRDHFRYCTCLGAVAAIFAVSIHSVFDFGLHITANALVFACLVVIATANCTSQTKEHRVEPTAM